MAIRSLVCWTMAQAWIELPSQKPCALVAQAQLRAGPGAISADLGLLHVRLIESPDGATLGTIISDIMARLDEPARRTFENDLLRRGLMPHDTAARSGPRVQMRTIEAYRVEDSFPRLERSSVPQAVTDAQYALDLRPLVPFLTPAQAVLEQFQNRTSE
jgi:Putative  PD-(D/E)XK family member, (DUF4420)